MRIRLQRDGPKRSLGEELRISAREKGILALWANLTPSLLLVFLPVIQMTLFETMKRARLRLRKATSLSAAEAFIIGAVAKAVAATLTHPFEVLQSRIAAAAGRGGKDAAKSTLKQFVSLVNDEGPSGCFSGLQARLPQTIAFSALAMTLTERSMAAFHAIGGGVPPVY
eukprot:NODE_25264_length_593_cov_3.815451.p2 GENE.NODE_25264_length_593_cov_3.815451~~NODE_25264_length_593_cov_3.815451.p2  ORF type:complete len:181 (-),score=55.61 NODE_25264_length_593_cov_3.815451:49-555(-)